MAGATSFSTFPSIMWARSRRLEPSTVRLSTRSFSLRASASASALITEESVAEHFAGGFGCCGHHAIDIAAGDPVMRHGAERRRAARMRKHAPLFHCDGELLRHRSAAVNLEYNHIGAPLDRPHADTRD